MNRLAHAILELVGNETPPRALHLHELATRLEVSDRRVLSNALDDLVAEGLLRLRPGQRYAAAALTPPPAPSAARPGRAVRPGSSVETAPRAVPRDPPRDVEGILACHARGFGFVRVGGGIDDVFIPADAIGGAMHGDRVKAQIANESRRGLEGSITEIVHRGRKRVVGVLRGRRGAYRLEPDDLRVRGPIEIVSDEADGGAPLTLEPGTAAVVAFTRYPRFNEELPQGRVIAALGAPGEPDVEVNKILIEHEIDEEQPEAAVAEARAYGQTVDPAEAARRVDLRHLKLVTIDPKTARDHDDAVWVEREGQGGFRAWIAIADVSFYVRPGMALDASALGRGNSVYLPDRSIPMLPHDLSSGLCSLLPRQERLCMCVEVAFDADGQPKETRIYEGRMRSHAFLTYDSVARALGWSDIAERDPEADAMASDLLAMWELSSKLRERRMQRGALDLDLPESDIIIDDVTRAPTEIVQRAVDPGVRKAYRLIEELMLLANESVARYMLERNVPSIYRVHGAPDAEKLDRFGALCSELSIAFDPEAAADPRALSHFMRQLEGHPKKGTLHMLLLRAMQQARYDTTNVGHFGLASDAYLHFTSPIRRYSDLIVHRILRRSLRGESVAPTEQLLADLRTAALTSSERERLTMESERAIHDLYRALYMRSRIGEIFKGNVVALTSSSLYLQVTEPYVTVNVLFDDLGPGGYALDENGLRVSGKRSGEVVGLGDELTITVFDVSITRRTVYGRRNGGGEQARPLNREERRGGGTTKRTVTTGATDTRGPAKRGAPKRGATKSGTTKSGTTKSGSTKPGKKVERRPEDPTKPTKATRGKPKPKAKGKPRISSSHGGPPARKTKKNNRSKGR